MAGELHTVTSPYRKPWHWCGGRTLAECEAHIKANSPFLPHGWQLTASQWPDGSWGVVNSPKPVPQNRIVQWGR